MLGQFPGKLKGRVEVEISGPGVERFLNLCLQNEIKLREIKWLNDEMVIVQVPLKDFGDIPQIVRQSNCRIHIRRRLGLPFQLRRVKKRKVLLIGALFFGLCFYVMGNFIFKINLSSPYPVERELKNQIIAAAQNEGVQIGKPRWRLDFDEIEQALLSRFPSLTWINITFKGTVVEISIAERTDIEEEDQIKPPGDILAAKDGLVQDVLVRKGTAIVASGDTVAANQMLIAGKDLAGSVAASGIVKAKVWYEGYGECDATVTELKNTGCEYQKVILAWGGRERLVLAGSENSPYEFYDESQSSTTPVLWRNLKLPVEVIVVKYKEQVENINDIGEEAAWDYARQAAEKAALREVPFKSEILDTKIIPFEDTGNTKRVKVVVEVLEDIALFQPWSGAKIKNWQYLNEQNQSPGETGD